MKLRNLFQSFLLLLFSLFSFYVSAQLDFDKSNLNAAGLSSSQLHVLDSVMHTYVDNDDFSAIQTAIVKNGKIVHYNSYGYSEIATKKNLREDDIFRIASMTKPIVSVALMKLYEEGHFKLNDPVYKFIPEFKNLTVKKRKKEKPIKK